MHQAPVEDVPGDKSSVQQTPFTGGVDGSGSSAAVERVINRKNRPLCHHPRLEAKAEIDLTTHFAICASHDRNQADQIVVGNLVTAILA